MLFLRKIDADKVLNLLRRDMEQHVISAHKMSLQEYELRVKLGLITPPDGYREFLEAYYSAFFLEVVRYPFNDDEMLQIFEDFPNCYDFKFEKRNAKNYYIPSVSDFHYMYKANDGVIIIAY